ncbi:MAG TPA: hypothetical protein VIK91_13315, partial [Nannocystis sp.]
MGTKKKPQMAQWWLPESVAVDMNEGRIRLSFYPVSGKPFGIMLPPAEMLALASNLTKAVGMLTSEQQVVTFVARDGKPFDAETQKSLNALANGGKAFDVAVANTEASALTTVERYVDPSNSDKWRDPAFREAALKAIREAVTSARQSR